MRILVWGYWCRQYYEDIGLLNNKDIPLDNLCKHFKQLHSQADLLSLSLHQNSFKENFPTLEQTKDTQNTLDMSGHPISTPEIENVVKLLNPNKAPTIPGKIPNE